MCLQFAQLEHVQEWWSPSLTRCQEIDTTVGIMRDNINKVSERGACLDSLQDKTDKLAFSAQGFRRGANRVRKQMWWKDMKIRMCLIVGSIILFIIIIVPSKPYFKLYEHNKVANNI
jgi:hypothetical protein